MSNVRPHKAAQKRRDRPKLFFATLQLHAVLELISGHCIGAVFEE